MSRARRRQLNRTALVLGRSDFRETSRVVTLLTREEGRMHVLAKGAHRPSSPCLGRVDLLNTLQVQISWREGTLPLLGRINLLHEPRALRRPGRFLHAARMVELARAAAAEERPDPELFELVEGGTRLLARCPMVGLPQVWTGWQLRLLRHLGRLPELDRCSACGKQGPLGWWPEGGELRCRTHAPTGSRGLAATTMTWLRALDRTPGARWHSHPGDSTAAAACRPMLTAWLRLALDHPLKMTAAMATRGAQPTV